MGVTVFDPKLTFRWVNFFHLVNGIFKDFAIRAKIFMHFSETTSGGSLFERYSSLVVIDIIQNYFTTIL